LSIQDSESTQKISELFVVKRFGATCRMAQVKATGDLSDANFPKDAEGRVYHLGLKYGELANRIVIMGCSQRLELVKSLFDSPENVFVRNASRGFFTATGRYKGVPVSAVAIGMGTPMVDFFYREGRNITKGPLAIIRLGTCGTPRQDVPIGSIAVSETSRYCALNFDAGLDPALKEPRYTLTKPLGGDPELLKVFEEELVKSVSLFNPKHRVVRAGDVTADSFYSTQGRIDPHFDDQNADLIDIITSTYPEAVSIQMETYVMYYLSKICYTKDIASAACGIVLAQRKSGEFLDHDSKHGLEKCAGIASLDALIRWGDDKQGLMDNDPDCVWNK